MFTSEGRCGTLVTMTTVIKCLGRVVKESLAKFMLEGCIGLQNLLSFFVSGTISRTCSVQ